MMFKRVVMLSLAVLMALGFTLSTFADVFTELAEQTGIPVSFEIRTTTSTSTQTTEALEDVNASMEIFKLRPATAGNGVGRRVDTQRTIASMKASEPDVPAEPLEVDPIEEPAAEPMIVEEPIALPAEEPMVETIEEPVVEPLKEGTIVDPSMDESDIVLEEYTWDSIVLDSYIGTVQGPNGKETYYNLDMTGVIWIMEDLGYTYEYSVREDGVKMYGPFIMCAADLSLRPRGSIIKTSLGWAMVCDTGIFVNWNPTQLDIAVTW